MQKAISSVKLAWHLGLGDAITFAPLVMQLAFKASQKGQKVEVPCWTHNYISVRSFFPQQLVMVTPVNNDAHMAKFCEKSDIKLGEYSGMTDFDNYIENMWKQSGENFEDRWLYCPINGNANHYPQFEMQAKIIGSKPPSDYIFVHDDKDRGYEIRRDLLRQPQAVPFKRVQSILAWANVIRNASEIHVIDSSFFHFVEALNIKDKPLFLHAYARTDGTNVSTINPRLDWTIYKDKPNV